jgi:hypothetical protein
VAGARAKRQAAQIDSAEKPGRLDEHRRIEVVQNLAREKTA